MSLIPLAIALVGVIASAYGFRASTHRDDRVAATIALGACVLSGGIVTAALGEPATAGTALGGVASAVAGVSA